MHVQDQAPAFKVVSICEDAAALALLTEYPRESLSYLRDQTVGKTEPARSEDARVNALAKEYADGQAQAGRAGVSAHAFDQLAEVSVGETGAAAHELLRPEVEVLA